jgi:type IV pilus assembly protein PilM
LGLFSSETNTIGVDVGSSAIRLVQLRKTGSRPTLVAFGSAQLPRNIAQSDSKLDQQKVAHIIKQVVKSANVNTKNVVASLPGSAVFTTVVKLPPMTSKELPQAVRYQAEQNIPLKIDEVKIDWQVIRENPTTKELAVMIVAATKTKVDRLVELFDMAELNVEYLETSAISTARALATPTDPLVMIVDIGEVSTELTIVENGIVTHTRSLPSAGSALTRVIAKNLGLDEPQAEQFKRKFGLSQDKLEGQVFKTMKPVLNNVTDEIERSIKFYQEQYGGTVQKLVLTGGGAYLLEIISYLKSIFNLEVVYGNAWANVNYQPNAAERLNQNSLEFSCAVGLAMREVL